MNDLIATQTIELDMNFLSALMIVTVVLMIPFLIYLFCMGLKYGRTEVKNIVVKFRNIRK